MRRTAVLTGLALAMLMVSAGCAMTGAEMDERLAQDQARFEALETQVTSLGETQKDVNAQVAALTKKLDEGLATIDAAAKNLAEVRLKVDAFREQLSQLTDANKGAQTTLIQSLETALAIHQQQFGALTEALEEIKKKTAAVLPAKPE